MSVFDRHRIFLYQNFLLYAIAFLIPLWPKAVPVLIILFGACSVFAILKKYSRAEMSQVSILLLIYFFLHVIGLIYTENQPRGWFDVQVKLSLMAFPLAFVGFRYLNTTNYNRILRMFLVGTLLAASICLLQSCYKYFILDQPYYHFLTSRFSVLIHQSYFALYMIFSLVILIFQEWPIWLKSKWRSMFNFSAIILLSVAVVLTGSKSGFIMWIVITIVLTALFIKEAKHKWIPIMALGVLMSLMGVIVQNAPLLQSRIVNVLEVAQSDEVKPKSAESTAVRYLVYSTTWDIIKTQPWYGNGTGDFQDVLDQNYNQQGYIHAAEKHLNAHNVFLQTWLSIGIHGFTTIIGIFLLLYIQAIRSRDWILLSFTLMFMVISFTESTFNVQAGVVFFSFFAVLLARRSMKAASSSSE